LPPWSVWAFKKKRKAWPNQHSSSSCSLRHRKLFSFVQFIGFFGPLIGIFLVLIQSIGKGFQGPEQTRFSTHLPGFRYQRQVSRGSHHHCDCIGGYCSSHFRPWHLAHRGRAGPEEIWRLAIYVVISLLYISFWLGISILFSVIFRSTATSALASLAIWIFFSSF